MIIPGVQKPHWRPCLSQNACCIGWKPPFCDSPSIVVTSLPSAWTASTVQDFTALPSRWIVQAPHWDVSQPTFVPVRPMVSRRKSTSRVRGATSVSRRTPLTVIATGSTGLSFRRVRQRERRYACGAGAVHRQLAEELGLLGLELVRGQQPLAVQVGELRERRDRVLALRRRRRGRAHADEGARGVAELVAQHGAAAVVG